MTHEMATDAPAGVGRLGTAAAWIAAACCLPYLFLKVTWTLGIPIGISDESLLDSNEWVAGNALMALLQLAGLVLVLALTRPWARRLPPWLVLFPVWVGTGLLFQVFVGSVLMALFASPAETSGDALGGIQGWVYLLVYATFAGQGIALAIAFGCYVRVRWHGLMRERTGDCVARRSTCARSWPERHLTELAQAVALTAVAVGAVCAYWAAGGEAGLSTASDNPAWYLQAARVVGAVTAAAGLLAMAGRWGGRTRWWLPVALVWAGSGALVAFDAFALFMNRLVDAFGSAEVAGWAAADSVVVAKALVGLLAAWVGVVAVRTAARSAEPTGPEPQPARELTGPAAAPR